MPKAKHKNPVLVALRAACDDEDAAAEFLEQHRWGGEPACPACGSVGVYRMTSRAGGRNKDRRLRCRDCGKMFSVRTGTVLEESRLPLRVWCFAFWSACSSKKGVSALQISRECEISYKSALFLMHRIRHAMTDLNPEPLTGTVEADETYVGGKPRNRGPHNPRGYAHKTPVFAMVQRDGKVRTKVLAGTVTTKAVSEAIRESVDVANSRLMTDEAYSYILIGREFGGGHERLNHKKMEYARGDATTNSVEGFFSLLKRGIYGTFHSVSKTHLHRYASEFEFRYNHRKFDDGERVVEALRGAEGKRLTYA